MPRVVFEPTIPVFKRAKTFHALDRVGTLIGALPELYCINYFSNRRSNLYYPLIHQQTYAHIST
jgi:hypothetical protein